MLFFFVYFSEGVLQNCKIKFFFFFFRITIITKYFFFIILRIQDKTLFFLQLFRNSYILSRRKIRKRKCFLFFFFENRGIKEYFSSSLKRVFTKLPKNSSILANQKNNNMLEKNCFFFLSEKKKKIFSNYSFILKQRIVDCLH